VRRSLRSAHNRETFALKTQAENRSAGQGKIRHD
jgi:hypothetical protein